jgi:hypothetical protein
MLEDSKPLEQARFAQLFATLLRAVLPPILLRPV